MVPVQTTPMPTLTPQSITDAVDHLAALTLDSDREVAAALIKCREALRAISWERFRMRTEEAAHRAHLARSRRAFVARHKGVRP